MTKRLTLRESYPPYALSIEEEDVLGQEPIILERDGQPVAAIVSLAEYEAFRVWQELFRPRNALSRRDIAPGSPGLRGPIARRCGRNRAPGPRSQSFLCQAGMSYVAHFTRYRRPFGGPQAAP